MKKFVLTAIIVLAHFAALAAPGKPVVRLTPEQASVRVKESEIVKALEEMRNDKTEGKEKLTKNAKLMVRLEKAVNLNLDPFMPGLTPMNKSDLTKLINASPTEVLTTIALISSIGKAAKESGKNPEELKQAIMSMEALIMASQRFVVTMVDKDTQAEINLQKNSATATNVAKAFKNVSQLSFPEAANFLTVLKTKLADPKVLTIEQAIIEASNGKFTLQDLIDCLV